ncbi:FkbM family methyltransferase [Phenylobacterium aquaticum]|uniref:FkbM family methyltransferase n=1 Tax=Phenylobacterium aquaticum TaxID=1763816 RepID=UPI0026EFFBA6|nr:FkbM family methyltransferase [Phenylobacterium aquaticum]
MVELTYADTLLMLVGTRKHTSQPSSDEQVAFLKFCLEHVSRSQGQFLQDLWVAYELKLRRNGFFVEFGGADGVRSSNSYYLETELGWNGIIAEPARVWREDLRRNRACAIDTRCVWRESGARMTFTQTPIAVHSTLEAYAQGDLHAATRVEGERYEVETVSLNDLLAHWRAPRLIDYLSIDTEGSELDILTAFDFDAHEVRLISVEHNHTDNRAKLFDLLTAKGYRRKFELLSNVDDWYVRVD